MIGIPERITLKLVRAWRVSWWCRECWQRGELLVARGISPYKIQAAANNLHFWSPVNCTRKRVRVEFNTRKEIKIPESKLISMPGFIGVQN
jgi:hypothetical protein